MTTSKVKQSIKNHQGIVLAVDDSRKLERMCTIGMSRIITTDSAGGLLKPTRAFSSHAKALEQSASCTTSSDCC